jgi:hypothetical protein
MMCELVIVTCIELNSIVRPITYGTVRKQHSARRQDMIVFRLVITILYNTYTN